MCLGIAGRIVELLPERPDIASVDVDGVGREVNVALLADDPAVPGEWVLIHLGFALHKLTREDLADLEAVAASAGEVSW